jgi:RNA polymerase sigma-70 factor (ECF subfamily)
VARFVGSRVCDRSLVEDLTSETFLRALRRIDSGGCQVRNAGAWFTTIARNLVLDHARFSRSRPERVTARIVDFPTVEIGPEWAAIRRDTGAEVRRHIGELPPDQRECIQLRFFRDLSVAETATVMGRSDVAVKALQHRGVRKLHAALSGDTR